MSRRYLTPIPFLQLFEGLNVRLLTWFIIPSFLEQLISYDVFILGSVVVSNKWQFI
jgi:hypothetical protein